jgi:hypothetical protein
MRGEKTTADRLAAFSALAHFKCDDHFSILATNSGQLQIERIDFLGALITHEQGSIVGS